MYVNDVRIRSIMSEYYLHFGALVLLFSFVPISRILLTCT